MTSPSTHSTPVLAHPAPTDRAPTGRAGSGRAFARHLGEMVLAMLVGMLVLTPAWQLVTALAGNPPVLARTDVAAAVMAAQMSIGMVVWMYHRRHPPRAVVEMVAAMVLATVAAVVPFWLGLLGPMPTHLLAHVLMIPAMAAAMLARLPDYTHGHRAGPDGRIRRALQPLADRWPTWIALLVTADQWARPGVPAAVLVVLGAEYLVIGALRRSFPDRRTLAWHVVGFLAYTAAAAVALVSDPVTAGVLVGTAWLLHAVWDGLLMHRGVVTWRWYAEACLVIDLVIGVTVLALVL